MTDLTEQDIYIGSLGQQKVYLNWQDVKDICANEVLEAYERTKRENAQLKELLKECSPYINRSVASRMIKNSAGYKKDTKLLAKINQALGEE